MQESPPTQEEVKAGFMRCFAAESPQAREDILKEIERRNPAAAREVSALLGVAGAGDAIDQVFGFSACPELAATNAREPQSPGSPVGDSLLAIAEGPGNVLGPYKLLEQIGEGGMGVVFMAHQTTPIKRKVALKIIKPGMDTRSVVVRFEAERQALALMDHPNIARVLDAGTTDNGRPYFVMELVKGIPLTEYCDREKLKTSERLQLFIDVCCGVQHAHQKGIIHRDLKPNNVMVTLHDGTPVVKIIDFGVAKAISQELTERTLFTQYSQMIGTPLYMSPEQAELSGLDVDTRSDVYSLGVLLYELLTGTTPFDRETLREAGLDEFRRIIRETEPPRPSKRLSTLNASDASTLSGKQTRNLRRSQLELQGELDWIVMKAIEKERNRRYDSARAFADDVRHYLADEPVDACPPSIRYRLKKYVRRNKGLLAATAVVLITAVCGTAASLWYANKANTSAIEAITAQEDADEQARKARALAADAESAADEAERSAEAARLAEVRESAERLRAEQALYVSDTRLAAAQVEKGTHAAAFESLMRQYPMRSKSDLRSWEWYRLLNETDRSKLAWHAHNSSAASIDWSPDGRRLGTVSSDGSARIWSADTGQELRSFSGGRTTKQGGRWNSKGTQFAWGSASSDSRVRIWDEEDDTITSFGSGTGSIWSVEWNLDGTQLLMGAITTQAHHDDRTLVRWEEVGNEWTIQARVKVPGNISFAGWSFDESLIVAVCPDSVRFYEPSNLELVHEIADKRTSIGAWHPAKNLLACGTNDGTCFVVNAESYAEIARFDAHFGKVRGLAWSLDRRWLASCGADGGVRVWDTNDWSLASSFNGHTGKVNSVSWHPNSKELVSCGDDGMVRIWSLEKRPTYFTVKADTGPEYPNFSWTEDNLIRVVSGPSTISDHDFRTGEISRTVALPSSGEWVLKGRDIALCKSSTAQRETTQVVNLTDSTSTTVEEQINGFCLASDGSAYVVDRKSNPRPLMVEPQSGRQTILGDEDLRWVQQMAWSPDKKHIAVVGAGRVHGDGYLRDFGWLHLFDTSSGAFVHRSRVGKNSMLAAAVDWSPDSQRIAAATRDGICEVFEVPSLRRLVSRQIHLAEVSSLAWHPSMPRIATGGRDRTVTIWDSESGDLLLKLPVDARVVHIEWSPAGKMLAAEDRSGTIHIWDASGGFELAESERFQERISRRLAIDRGTAIVAEKWSLAAKLGLELIERHADSTFEPYYQTALLALAADDHESFTLVSRRMLSQFSKSSVPVDAHFVGWTCALAPGALEDLAPAIALAQFAVDKEPNNQRRIKTLGAILMRDGQHEKAKTEFEKALSAPGRENTYAPYIHYLLALTEHHLGNSEHAAEQLQLATESAETELASSPGWNRKLTLQLFRREAESLIGEPDHKTEIRIVAQALHDGKYSGDWTAALEVIDTAISQIPDYSRLKMAKFEALLNSGEFEAANLYAERLAEQSREAGLNLNAIARSLVTLSDKEADLALAQRIALRATSLTDDKDPAILDTVARIHFELGELKSAIEWQEKACAIAPLNSGLSKTLRQYLTQTPLAIPDTAKLYWTDQAKACICRANLDGSDIEELPYRDLARPRGMID